MPTLSTQTTPYYGGGQVVNPANVIQTSGAPSANLVEQGLGTLAVDNAASTVYCLTSKTGGTAHWSALAAGSVTYSSTPYVVGPTGKAGYQTVQSAINAANTAGGGLVFIQNGTYTESLTLYSNVLLQGASKYSVTISGVHTPPTSGTLSFNEITFQSATDVLSSVAAGTTAIFFQHCNFTVTNGYTCNLANWTGDIELDLCGEVGSTNNGVLNNSTTATFEVYNSSVGAGTGHVLTTSASSITIDESSIQCPMTMAGSGTLTVVAGAIFTHTLTTAGSMVSSITNAQFNTGATAAITHGSSGSMTLSNVTINTSANPAIGGAGAGALIIGQVVWLNASIIASALNITTPSSLSASSFTTSNDTSWLTWTANALVAGGAATNEDMQLAAQAAGNVLVTVGNVVINQAGKQLRVHGGAVTDFIGTGTLVSGTVTIANTNIAATDRIFLQRTGANASTTLGELSYTISAATSFTVTSLILGTPASTQTADVSSFTYFIVRQV